jgi:protein TonB
LGYVSIWELTFAGILAPVGGILRRDLFNGPHHNMFEPKIFARKADHRFMPPPQSRPLPPPKQQRLMVAALTLLIVALGFVLYRDRDFWFPDSPEAEEQPQPTAPVDSTIVATRATSSIREHEHKKTRTRGSHPSTTPIAPDSPAPPPGFSTTDRTVLPPLEVEVVAGDLHRTVRPGTNALDVETQPESPRQKVPDARADDGKQTTASVTSAAAERVNVSAETADVVTLSVKPSYPLLARQMKVQGSVVLQAMISRNGQIQDLHVVTGPPILASAAKEAVRQWHFKPHYEGAEAVETQTRITVNFTISTN